MLNSIFVQQRAAGLLELHQGMRVRNSFQFPYPTERGDFQKWLTADMIQSTASASSIVHDHPSVRHRESAKPREHSPIEKLRLAHGTKN